jgi:hypothetical protein
MCIICIELVKQRMTITEAERNVGEMVSTAKDDKDFDHYVELDEALYELDLEKLGKVLEDGSDEGLA